MSCVLAVIECVAAIYWSNIIACPVVVNAVIHIAADDMLNDLSAPCCTMD